MAVSLCILTSSGGGTVSEEMLSLWHLYPAPLAQDWLRGSMAASREGISSCDGKHAPGLASVSLVKPRLRVPGETWMGLALKVQRWLAGDRRPVCVCDAHVCLESWAALCPRLHVGSPSPENLSMGTRCLPAQAHLTWELAVVLGSADGKRVGSRYLPRGWGEALFLQPPRARKRAHKPGCLPWSSG